MEVKFNVGGCNITKNGQYLPNQFDNTPGQNYGNLLPEGQTSTNQFIDQINVNISNQINKNISNFKYQYYNLTSGNNWVKRNITYYQNKSFSTNGTGYASVIFRIYKVSNGLLLLINHITDNAGDTTTTPLDAIGNYCYGFEYINASAGSINTMINVNILMDDQIVLSGTNWRGGDGDTILFSSRLLNVAINNF